jgi:excisionase family DNA binding protein
MFEKVPDILTVKECQQLLKIGKKSMLNFLHTGEMEGFKIGNKWRVYKESVIDFIRRR